MSRVTPLMVAIEGGSLAVVQELIIKGVDIDVADARGRNVFHYAAMGTNTAIIQVCVFHYAATGTTGMCVPLRSHGH